jgi:hypothetical protein
MAHTLRVGCGGREFRVTARGDKSLKSVAKSIAKRLGCSRVSLFANARALDESLTVGALAASGVGRVEAVPCDDAPAAAPTAPAAPKQAAPAPASVPPPKPKAPATPRIETAASTEDALAAAVASLAAFAPTEATPEPKKKDGKKPEPRACPGCAVYVYKTREGRCLACGADLSGDSFKRGFLATKLEGLCVVVADTMSVRDIRKVHLKHLRRGALVDVKDDDGATCSVVSQEFPGLRGYVSTSDLARFDGDDLHAQTFTSLWEAPPLQEVHEGHIRGKVERVWLRRRGPWLDEVLQADAIIERSEGWAARCIKSGRAGAVFHPLQECEPVLVCRGRLRDDELRSDDEADARGEPPPSLKPWDVSLQLCADVGRGWRPSLVKADVWAARGEAAYALDKHAAAVYAFTIALSATDDGVLYRARAAALWRGRADGRKEDEGEPPRAFPLVLGLLAVRDTRTAQRRGASVAGDPWATILGFARRAQVPDMLGVVEQEWVRHSPEKKTPLV